MGPVMKMRIMMMAMMVMMGGDSDGETTKNEQTFQIGSEQSREAGHAAHRW